ncbi:hypothetical protein ACWGQ5_40235 [Streptomyces sp. NPDC055722]
MEVPEADAEFPGAAQQDGFEVVLAAQTPGGGTELRERTVRIDVPEQPLAAVGAQGRIRRMPYVLR